MGRLNNNNMQSKQRPQDLEPDKIYSRENNLFVKPIEARFFKISLAVSEDKLRELKAKASGASEISDYQDSPFIAYFLKNTNSISLRKNTDKVLDLQIFVSRTDPFPND